MTKKDFIQRYVIANTPPPKGANPIEYAEALWAKLSVRGYGHRAPETRDNSKDFYKELSQNAKERFDAFWTAFSYKKARNNAAMRWFQMEQNGISDEEFDQIIFAAKEEAKKRANLPTASVPIMGQGWLNQMRWRDIEVPTKKEQQIDENRQRRQELIADINHFKTQQKISGSDVWKEQIERCEKELKNLSKGDGNE